MKEMRPLVPEIAILLLLVVCALAPTTNATVSQIITFIAGPKTITNLGLWMGKCCRFSIIAIGGAAAYVAWGCPGPPLRLVRFVSLLAGKTFSKIDNQRKRIYWARMTDYNLIDINHPGTTGNFS